MFRLICSKSNILGSLVVIFAGVLPGFAAYGSVFQVSPTAITLLPGAHEQFMATVNGVSGATVKWAVKGIVGGNAQVGTISATGLYTAPTTGSGSFVVSAINAVDATRSSTASVAVIEDPALTAVHEQWLAGVGVAATRYGCKGKLIEQLPTESTADVIKLFSLTSTEGSCLVLLPISTSKTSMRYSFAWGGQVDGKDIYYLSDVAKTRIWNGVSTSAQ
jgi:hypothetical protein